ncbi:uncharacterized protein LOC129801196 isoform X2 [Phlebotomus papatasi]|uniref:uncharacterized protein LOC129801196 isoform X2 n=1 Tax=Phlebotomus papatasi TaxID=29031 RepID=UPI002483B3BA|nr:uncharacterized protein LOC129801196 isoform X2 [Phlebotomus papatasi]
MLVLATLLAIYVVIVGSYSSYAPENITVTFINPTSVRVSWQTSLNYNSSKPIQKYDVTYKPTDARVVAEVAGNSEAVTLINLLPDTQYQLTVAALFNGKKFRSRPIVFRTLEPPKSSAHQGSGIAGGPFNAIGPPMSSQGFPDANYPMIGTYDEFGNLTNNSTTRELPTIRGVEVGIVVLVLFVWAGAIALFFNRWGKIRMLLPYQPDYKQEQGLKVPGTGVCSSGACNGQHSHQSYFRQHWPEEQSTVIEDRCTRNRINSAIFVSSEGKGFDSIEFLRRYGSQSVLCRKARSAENITSADQRVSLHSKIRRLSEHQNWNSSLREQDNSLNETFELVECHTPQIEEQATETATSVVVSVSAVPSISGEFTTTTANNAAAQMSQKTRQKVTNLPTLSISGPSPPHEEFL